MNPSKGDKLLEELTYYKNICAELELIMDTTFDLISVTDEKGIFLRMSKSSEKIFGMPESQLVGKSIYELKKEGVFTPSITEEILKNKKKVTIVQETACGKRLLATGMPMFNKKGKLIKVINVAKDITEADNLKRQLEETEDILNWFRNETYKKLKKEGKVIIANSNSMKKIVELIEHIGNMDTTIILLGETGVGKSLIAKVIHDTSKRRDYPFVHINCGAIPENLIESELFGYEKGAFTGAVNTGKKGLLEVASEGTVFLDEIGEISMSLQVKLLNVLQEKKAYKVGGTEPFEIKARIISATNKDLKKLVKEGKFREDLYYRLNIVPISIPPLRERIHDIPIFINHFLEKCNEKYNLSKRISSKAYKLLLTYNWPGNIREMENTVERLVVTCNEEVIEENDIFDTITDFNRDIYETNEFMTLKEAKDKLEKQMLLKALEKYKTTRKISEALEIDQSTVAKKLKKFREEGIVNQL